jgi:DNA-binding transcriptional LysR family regulator
VDLPLELRQLRYFVAVAEELHFGRAAERLHMSQSPLSRAIRELERELDLVLFVRTTRHVELTPAGEALLERARRALAEIDAAVDDARRAVQPDGLLAIGFTPVSRSPAMRILEELQTQGPELRPCADRTFSRGRAGRRVSGSTKRRCAPWQQIQLAVIGSRSC